MSKHTFTITRKNHPDRTCRFEFDLNQNLVNNLRIFSQKREADARVVIPAELNHPIENGLPFEVSAEFVPEEKDAVIKLDPLVILSEQIGPYLGNNTGGGEIRLCFPGDETKAAIVPSNKKEIVKPEKTENEEIIPRPVSYFRRNLILAGILLCFIATLFTGRADKYARKVEKYLEKGQYGNAVDYYNRKIEGHKKREKAADPLMTREMDELESAYFDIGESYDYVRGNLEYFTRLKKNALREYAWEIIAAIDEAEAEQERGTDGYLGELSEEELPEPVEWTAEQAFIKVFNGSMAEQAEPESYDFIAEESGNYRFDLSGMRSGFSVTMEIRNEAGERVEKNYGLGNNYGMSAVLEKGRKYTLEITGSSGEGDYTLSICAPKQEKDVSDYDRLYDSIEFTGQQNRYLFKPEEDGVYRFDYSEIRSGFRLNMFVYDSLGYRVESAYGISNGGGLTVQLKRGEEYSVSVEQADSIGSYVLTVGKQKTVRNITGMDGAAGYIVFENQEANFDYTPDTSGEITFSFEEMEKGFDVHFCVFDRLGYRIASYYGVGNMDSVEVEMEEGQTYRIQVIQENGTGYYRFRIGEW